MAAHIRLSPATTPSARVRNSSVVLAVRSHSSTGHGAQSPKLCSPASKRHSHPTYSPPPGGLFCSMHQLQVFANTLGDSVCTNQNHAAKIPHRRRQTWNANA
nr:MAG TPA: hypothetical protein [Caudoviricetes sp.]